MPKSNAKAKKAPRATETTLKDASQSAGESSPKETAHQRANGSTSAESGSHAKKRSSTKEQAPATATAPSAKSTRRTTASKRKEVRLPGPYVEPFPSESDTDTSNPDVITGDEDSTAGTPAPRATKPSEGEPASACTTASEPAPAEEASIPSPDVSSDARKAEDFLNSGDAQDPKSSTSATPSTRAPPQRLPPPEDGPGPVDYEESEPDQDREQGGVSDSNLSPQLTEQQRVTHPGSPMTPKNATAVARVEAQARRETPRDTASAARPGHLSERTQQVASQTVGTKCEREASTPRTREQLLALRYRTLDEYREHLRLSRRLGPGVSQCDQCPVVLWDDTGLTHQTNEREFEAWLRFLGYACPEFLASPYRID
ncbi:unnamed protein product [Phytophthora fragariaefolia]|uniref:Unnamed protein product n=1 Tax=Phytophthora fragariaefolia TaxID=1490495 RepID=A0A9W6XJQ5_9STRA|nr:unnamed protein product [Phytophthora fragariaefolia]